MCWRELAIALACTFVSCDEVAKVVRQGQRVLPAHPPLLRVETFDDGVTLDVWLLPGAGISQVVDLDMFHPLSPGVTPDRARRQFGAPTEIFGVGHEKHYVYRTPKTAVAIVETVATASGDGTSFKAYELRAEARPGLQEKMPPSLRRLINAHPAARTVRIASADVTDPVIHLHIRNGIVQHVTAWPIDREKVAKRR